MISRITGFFIICGSILLFGCGGGIKPTDTDTPTTGKFKIGIDDSYSLLMDAELYTFQSLYPYSRIDTVCRTEADIINAFMKDSLSLIVVSRKLTQDEEAQLNAKQVLPKTTKIAYDAVALITNRDNPDSTLLYDQVREIFEGKIKTWKEIKCKIKACRY